MTMRALRDRLMKTGRYVILLGVLVSVGGMYFGNPTIVGIGCVAVFGGAYATVYAHVGSF